MKGRSKQVLELEKDTMWRVLAADFTGVDEEEVEEKEDGIELEELEAMLDRGACIFARVQSRNVRACLQ